MPFAEYQAQVHGDERQDEAGETKTWSVKKRDSVSPAIIGPATSGARYSPNERDTPHHRRPDAQPPVGILVKAQHLPRKGHPQRAEQQHTAGDPGQFSRVFVGPNRNTWAMCASMMPT